MFTFSFYIFSSLLSFTDYKKFIVPNNILIAMSIMMIIFGIFESRVYTSQIVLTVIVLFFFIFLLLINPELYLGGGDIKYMMVVAFYLGVQAFALFLIVVGVLQTLLLIYVQNVKKRRFVPMVPAMFLSVIIVEILVVLDIYPIKF